MIKINEPAEISNTERQVPPWPFKAPILAACAAAGLAGLTAPAAATPSDAPPNQAARSAVGLTFDREGTGFAFYRGEGDAVYMRTFTGWGTWSAQTGVGGAITGAPSAAAAGTKIVTAARGKDGALWLRTMAGGAWGPWTTWGGALSSAPAVTGGGDGRVDAFARGTDGALWTRTLRADGTKSAWRSLGGRLATAPAAVTIQNDSFDLAAAGTDHRVWRATTATGWKWTSIGGRTYSAPAIGYIPQSNGLFVLVRGTDDALWANGLGGGGSTGWRSLKGRLIDGPTAAGTRQPAPHITAAIRSVDTAVWTTIYPTAEGSWSPFARAWIPDDGR
ncbi:hypothetical protein [Actinomadura sp. 3N508]|uniref:hypothetical protein n=1 Tax=Actinomadura sp. 3N508 TaxID=3375153 RepID=UPI0037937ED8